MGEGGGGRAGRGGGRRWRGREGVGGGRRQPEGGRREEVREEEVGVSPKEGGGDRWATDVEKLMPPLSFLRTRILGGCLLSRIPTCEKSS